MIYVALGIAALAAFIAFSWSLVCLAACRRGLGVGRIWIDADHARAFLLRGAFGAVSVPLFLLLADNLTDLNVPWEYFTYYAMGGYTLFSVGIEYLIVRSQSAGAVIAAPRPPHHQRPQELLPPPSQRQVPRYASWDDDEELGK